MAKWKVQLLGITTEEALRRSKMNEPIPTPVVQTWPGIEAETLYVAKKSVLPEISESPFGKALSEHIGRELVITDVLVFLKGKNHIDNREAEVEKSEVHQTFGEILKREKVPV